MTSAYLWKACTVMDTRKTTWSHGLLPAILACIALAWLGHSLFAQSSPTTPVTPAASDEVSNNTSESPVQSATKVPAAERYGWWVLSPALLAIILAVIFRQVIPALIAGTLTGAFMLIPYLHPGVEVFSFEGVIAGIRVCFENYVIERSIVDAGHVKIIVFTLVIGFTVGVIGASGGTAGLVMLIAGKARSRIRTALTAYFAGLVVFFDDYANTMVVGPTMRSVFDKVKLSRAKLAYIVDSTAAPVASIALIGTWVGFEIGFIREGLLALPIDTDPSLSYLQGASGFWVFVNSIPYRFYPLLALFLVFLVSLTGLDFGPMKRSELRARSKLTTKHQLITKTVDAKQPEPRWALGLLPILVLVGATLGVLWATGIHSPDTVAEIKRIGTHVDPGWPAKPWFERGAVIIGNSDSYIAILYGALASAFVAATLALMARACSLGETMQAGLDGMSRMFPAVVILVLAWAISAVSQDLELGAVVTAKLQTMNLEAKWLPTLVFLSAAGVSFATGTSWGTMGILCPLVVQVAANLAAPLATDTALQLFYASVGSVLAGAIFGDHCSPISDTTVLSSIAAECPHEEHVWTQIPYALITAVVSIFVGDLLVSYLNQPWYLGLGVSCFVLFAFLLIFGRKPVYRVPPLIAAAAEPHIEEVREANPTEKNSPQSYEE